MEYSELCWLAGLLEGEGSFCKGPPSKPNATTISISMTDEDVIARVAGMLGVSYSRSDRGADKGWKPVYNLQLRGSRAVELMARLKPMMGERRRQQIDSAIFSHTPVRPRLTETQRNEVRERKLADPTLSLRALSREFGVNHETIRKVLGNVS